MSIFANGVVLVAGIALFAASACQSDGPTVTPERIGAKVMEVTVGPELLDCVGLAPSKCLEVDGLLFYDPIEGFTHEEGYAYRLKIERSEAFPDREEPPQNASKYRYRLIEVISKTTS